MKNRMIAAALCTILFGITVNGEEKATQLVAKNNTQKSITSVADVMGDSNIMVEAAIGFVESFAVMGDCQEGQKARKEIEGKRDLATREIQDESKKFEKAKNDYVAKSSTMSDAARDKEEKQLMKMERELKNLVAEKEEELKADMQIATENLAHSLDASVAKLAQNQNLDIVIDKMTGRAMYVSDKFDFTDQAIKEMDKNYEVKLAQNSKQQEATKVADNKAAAPKATKVNA
ncbi:MAG TPA: OmpH family outer membrane protein [Candidatus Babeliales bacterium]|nr:OmpH family outer membrane protein [Candidatus Babeliales bacterium]